MAEAIKDMKYDQSSNKILIKYSSNNAGALSLYDYARLGERASIYMNDGTTRKLNTETIKEVNKAVSKITDINDFTPARFAEQLKLVKDLSTKQSNEFYDIKDCLGWAFSEVGISIDKVWETLLDKQTQLKLLTNVQLTKELAQQNKRENNDNDISIETIRVLPDIIHIIFKVNGIADTIAIQIHSYLLGQKEFCSLRRNVYLLNRTFIIAINKALGNTLGIKQFNRTKWKELVANIRKAIRSQAKTSVNIGARQAVISAINSIGLNYNVFEYYLMDEIVEFDEYAQNCMTTRR